MIPSRFMHLGSYLLFSDFYHLSNKLVIINKKSNLSWLPFYTFESIKSDF